jgi:DNA-binding winged helix-turn-helix (wHTH) protein
MSVDELIEKCWPKQFIGDNPLHKCITQLRKTLGDTIKNPQYIKTNTKRGYTIIAEIKGKALVNESKWNDTLFRLKAIPDSFH